MTDTHTIDPNDPRLTAFITDVTTTLVAGQKHKVAGFGTFTTCTRKATLERPECTIAMFRPDAALRAFVNGGPAVPFEGQHQHIAEQITRALQSGAALDLPAFGHMAAVPVKGKAPKLIFHGAPALNDALSAHT